MDTESIQTVINSSTDHAKRNYSMASRVSLVKMFPCERGNKATDGWTSEPISTALTLNLPFETDHTSGPVLLYTQKWQTPKDIDLQMHC